MSLITRRLVAPTAQNAISAYNHLTSLFQIMFYTSIAVTMEEKQLETIIKKRVRTDSKWTSTYCIKK